MRDIDQLHRKAAVTQMVPEIESYPDGINLDQEETGTKLVEKIDCLPASIFCSPRTHSDDSAPILISLAHVNHRFRFSVTDVHTRH
jgi:hypothetical protein